MKIQKKCGIAAIALGIISLLGQPILAQNSAAPTFNSVKRSHNNRLEQLSKQLDLTEAQQSKIKGFMAEHHSKAAHIRKDTALTPEQQKEKLKIIRKDLMLEIKGVLTDEQVAKFKSLHHHTAK